MSLKEKHLTKFSRMLLLFALACQAAVLFFPMWRIELDAPQYPEGLALMIYPGKLAGDVEIINGLNHYIGMKTLHANDFVEFTILPYIIGFCVLLIALVWALNSVRVLRWVFFFFLSFAIIAMIDFWRWEYDYGHNLNPEAAIRVPGMAYQPPLIGFKQLLNFGAYSIPDIGGWLFIVTGILLFTALILNTSKLGSKFHPGAALSLLGLPVLLLASCSSGPAPIAVGKDHCDYCRMDVADVRFAAEIVTTKGKIYKFDDLQCAIDFIEHSRINEAEIEQVYVSDFEHPDTLLKVDSSFLFHAPSLNSPMRGNTVAVSSERAREHHVTQTKGARRTWREILKK